MKAARYDPILSSKFNLLHSDGIFRGDTPQWPDKTDTILCTILTRNVLTGRISLSSESDRKRDLSASKRRYDGPFEGQ